MRIHLTLGPPMRRLALGLTAALVSVGTLGACSSDEDTASVTYAGFGGTYEESIKNNLFDPYSEETGVEVLYDSTGSNVAKLISMSESGSMNLDLIDAEDSSLAQFIAADILEPIETSDFTGDLANPEAVTEYSVPWYTFSRNLFWNAEQVPQGLNSWSDLFDTENNPGKRGFVSLPWGTLEGALIADGVAVEDLYPLDLDRAFAKLDEIRDDAIFFSSNGDLQNAISQGEIAMGYGNLARIKSVAESGAVPLEYTWVGAVLSTQQLVIPAGAPNKDDALKAIEYSMKPETQEAILADLGYTPSLASVLDSLDEDELSDLPGTQQTASDETFSIDIDWWAENGDEALRQWQDWLNE